MAFSGLLLALIWGFLWAALLEWAPWGRYLAARRAWLAVAIGVSADLALLTALLPLTHWLAACAVFALSGIGLIVRSLYHEWRDNEELLARAPAARSHRGGDVDQATPVDQRD